MVVIGNNKSMDAGDGDSGDAGGEGWEGGGLQGEDAVVALAAAYFFFMM